jgi:hypothetical protein
MYLSAKKTAKRKGLDFDITYEYLQQLKESQNNECPYSGMQLNWDIAPIQREYRVPPDRASIERRDSKKGYTKDNVELVAHCVNLMKNEYAHPFLYLTCHQIVENMNRRQVIEYFLYN